MPPDEEMKIQVFVTPSISSAEEIRNSTVVVIDTLRATSTIVAALNAGAREVVPAGSTEQAVRLVARFGAHRALLCGERRGVRIEGFDLGNSPLEFTTNVVSGKSLVMTTTNGTAAFHHSRHAESVLCGALLNAGAVAGRLLDTSPDSVILLCAGTYGRLSLEDLLAAGAILHELGNAGLSFQLTDGATTALLCFRYFMKDIPGALRSFEHGRTLAGLGFDDDIVFCGGLNTFRIVPMMIGSTIRLA